MARVISVFRIGNATNDFRAAFWRHLPRRSRLVAWASQDCQLSLSIKQWTCRFPEPPSTQRSACAHIFSRTRTCACARDCNAAVRFNGTLWNIDSGSASLRLDAREFDHLGPLFGFVSYELAEIGRRAGKYRAAEVGQPRLHLGIGEGGVDLFVELVDDFGRRGFRCADAEPEARLISRHKLTDGRHIG